MIAHPPVARTLTDLDIDWELPPAPDDDTSEDVIVDALLDAQSYRVLAQQAIHALHDLQQRYDRQRDAYYRALDALKHLRAAQRERAA